MKTHHVPLERFTKQCTRKKVPRDAMLVENGYPKNHRAVGTGCCGTRGFVCETSRTYGTVNHFLRLFYQYFVPTGLDNTYHLCGYIFSENALIRHGNATNSLGESKRMTPL